MTRKRQAGATAYARAGMDPSPVALAAREADGVLTLDLFDFIGEDFFGEGITARAVTEKLAGSSAQTVKLRINSPGGFAFEGHAIRSLVRAHAAETGAKIVVEVHGLAASAATTIAMAGDEVVIAEDAMFMIHEAWNLAIGEADDMRHQADILDKFNESMAKLYVSKTGKGNAEIRKMMKAETWMTGSEAVEHGFADALLDVEDVDVAAAAPERVFAALSKFDNVPDGLLDRYRSQRGELLVAAMSSKPAPAASTTPQGSTMDRKTIIALLGLDASATDDTITAALREAGQFKALLAETRAELKEAKAEAEAIKAEAEVKDIEHRLSLARTVGHDGKGARLTQPAAKSLTEKFIARAKKGGAFLAVVLEDLEEIEARAPAAHLGKSQVRSEAELDDATKTGEHGLTKAELDYCERYGKDPKEVAAIKAKAKAKVASGMTDED